MSYEDDIEDMAAASEALCEVAPPIASGSGMKAVQAGNVIDLTNSDDEMDEEESANEDVEGLRYLAQNEVELAKRKLVEILGVLKVDELYDLAKELKIAIKSGLNVRRLVALFVSWIRLELTPLFPLAAPKIDGRSHEDGFPSGFIVFSCRCSSSLGNGIRREREQIEAIVARSPGSLEDDWLLCPSFLPRVGIELTLLSQDHAFSFHLPTSPFSIASPWFTTARLTILPRRGNFFTASFL